MEHGKCILFCMWRPAKVLFSLALTFAIPAMAVDGLFQGQVVLSVRGQPVAPGWVYILGRNHMLRRVDVSHASIVFSKHLGYSRSHSCNTECLADGQEVRVIAAQDRSGEWRAKRVEVLSLAKSRDGVPFTRVTKQRRQ